MPARFAQRLKLREPIDDLKLAVSMENKRQKGSGVKEFVELIDRHNTPDVKMKNITILLSCDLQRHYIGKNAALRKGDKWIDENEEHFKTLKQGVNYKIILK